MIDAILEYYKDDKEINAIYDQLEYKLTILLEHDCISWDNRLLEVSKLYYYLYCVPLLEELRKNRKSIKENELIYSHFLFCLFARFQDNILDEDFEVFDKVESMRLSCTILTEARLSFTNTGAKWDKRMSKVFDEFYKYEERLQKPDNIDYDFLYNRVSFLLIIPEALAEQMGNCFITPYQHYLNYCLLRHDIHDMLKDIIKIKRSFITDKFELKEGFYMAKTIYVFKEVSETLNNFIHMIKESSVENNFFEVAFIKAIKDFEV